MLFPGIGKRGSNYRLCHRHGRQRHSRTLGDNWAAATGNSITFVGGAVGKVESTVTSGTPGDVVILPASEFSAVASRVKPGSPVAIGRILFGLAVAKDAPHPDISTEAKLQIALRGAKTVSYNDPGMSMGGVMVQKLLAQPGYDGVKTLQTNGGSANAIPKGNADMTLGVIPEELPAKGVDVVGPLPASLNLHIDFSGAVLTDSAQPAAAASFLAYISRPEAAATWKAGGVIAPIP